MIKTLLYDLAVKFERHCSALKSDFKSSSIYSTTNFLSAASRY